MNKDELINRLVKQPDEFTSKELDDLLNPERSTERITPGDLRKIALRIFDKNDTSFRNKSTADIGVTGILNRLSRKGRNLKYMRKINRGFRASSENKIILAEGDSWFEFPFFISDIVDWLKRRSDYAVFSLAYGGDWLENIIYQGEYIEGLPVHTPDVFLISGGGNDMVGGNRLTTMIINPLKDELNAPSQKFVKEVNMKVLDKIKVSDIIKGKQYLTNEFTSFIKLIKLQYELMFTGIFTKYPDMKIITHGYDYAIPSNKINFGLNPFQFTRPLLNLLIRNGKWLRQSFMLKGITDSELQRVITYTMIYEYNEMLISIALKPSYPNLFHIDCRGVCRDKKDWFDELHPKSYIFRRIAEKYANCIDGTIKDKIIKLV